MAGVESESRQVQFRFQQRLQDGEDGQSSASDDDRNAIEVGTHLGLALLPVITIQD